MKPKARPKIEDAMKLRFSDYDGPTGLLIATGREMLPLDSIAGATAFIGAGMLAGTTDPDESAQIQAAIDAAVNSSGADSAPSHTRKRKPGPRGAGWSRGRV